MHSRIEIPQPGGLRREKAECGLKVAARRGALVRHVEDSKTVSCMKLPNTCVYKSTLHTSSHPLRRRPHLYAQTSTIKEVAPQKKPALPFQSYISAEFLSRGIRLTQAVGFIWYVLRIFDVIPTMLYLISAFLTLDYV
jgi:hypothetical protein